MRLMRFDVVWLLSAIFVLAFSGCASQQVRVKPPVYPIEGVVNAVEVATPDQVAATALESLSGKPTALSRFGIERVARRLSVYEGWLYRWRAVTTQYEEKVADGAKPLPDDWYDCMHRVEVIYEGYGRFRRGLVAGGDAATDASGSWEVVGADFDYQESGCIDLFQAQVNKSSVKKGTADDVESLGEAVLDAVNKGKYQEALDAFGEIERIGRPISVAVRQAYAVALLRTNKVDIALTELQKILVENGVFDTWAARLQVADLLLVTGKHEEAVKEYELLIADFDIHAKERKWVKEQLALVEGEKDLHREERAIYGEALRAYLTFDGKRIPGELKMWVARLEYKYPRSNFTDRARQLLSRVENESRGWISDKMRGVDALVEARQYKGAYAMLNDLLGQDLPAEMVEIVRKALDDVAVIELRALEELRSHTEQMLQDRWREAEHLFDSEQFDAAIIVFSTLFGTGYDVDARVKMSDAASLAAVKLRREGADLFFKAGQTADVEQKKELLYKSRQLLQTILDKYPYVDLVDKVTRNLQIIDEQLRVVDPLAVYDANEDGKKSVNENKGSAASNGSGLPW